jgi:uncharacterized protein YwgA
MITRQRTVLRLIELENGKVSKLRLFKLAFLLSECSKQAPASALYEFFPYQFGPYSFTLGHELRSMERDGWLRIFDTEVCASRPSQSETDKIETSLAFEIESLVDKYQGL